MSLSIDLDSEAIQYEGKWYTRDELARRIKSMLDAGDFAISKPSQALEQLTATIAGLRTVAFRAPPELADALNAHAAQVGKSAGQFVREAVAAALGKAVAPAEAAPARTTPAPQPAIAPPAPTPAPIPAPIPAVVQATPLTRPIPLLNPSAQPQPLPTVMVEAGVVSEPITADEAASAVTLTPKKKDEEDVERRWFGG